MPNECSTGELDMSKVYKGVFRSDVDPRELALYTPADAACYLGINPQTLSTWIWGRTYPVVGGEKRFEPVMHPADPDNRLLSFFNLAELHVLAATRYKHRISFPAVRTAVDTTQKRYPSAPSSDFKRIPHERQRPVCSEP